MAEYFTYRIRKYVNFRAMLISAVIVVIMLLFMIFVMFPGYNVDPLVLLAAGLGFWFIFFLMCSSLLPHQVPLVGD